MKNTMRKNGVNRDLEPIPGGVCAPKGFKACGVRCGIAVDGKRDFAMIVAAKHCPTACVYSTCSQVGAPISVTKWHLQRSKGMAQAILVNSGTANVFLDNGEALINEICLFLERKTNISVDETVIASTGSIGEKLYFENFEYGIKQVMEKLSDTHEASLSAAEAIMTTDSYAKQVSYMFALGDYPCKIGAIFKGTHHVAPNMATTLAFLTTDVNITPKALQRALSVAIRDTFNLLTLDDIASPNDMVCIMANGTAGNYIIDGEDSEYQKFVYALKSVLFEICKKIASDCNQSQKVLFCTVKGAKSKQAARSLALSLARSQRVCDLLSQGMPCADSIIYSLLSVGENIGIEDLTIRLASSAGEVMLFADERPMLYGDNYIADILSKNEVELIVDFWRGNFSATAISSLKK